MLYFPTSCSGVSPPGRCHKRRLLDRTKYVFVMLNLYYSRLQFPLRELRSFPDPVTPEEGCWSAAKV